MMNNFVNKSEVLRTVNILIRKQREENYFDSVYDVLTYLKGLLWQMNSVQVIRCRHCKYFDPDSEYCQFWHNVRHPEHFCSEGEKKNNG